MVLLDPASQLMKFSKLRDYPILETSMFVIMSYSTFLFAEFASLTGECVRACMHACERECVLIREVVGGGGGGGGGAKQNLARNWGHPPQMKSGS